MKTTITQVYLSQAEGLLDMSGYTKNPELVNQRQPNPQNWGLKVKVTKAVLKKPVKDTVHYRLDLDIEIEGKKKQTDAWLAEHSRMHGLATGQHVSKDTSLNAQRKAAKKAQKKAQNASKKTDG